MAKEDTQAASGSLFPMSTPVSNMSVQDTAIDDSDYTHNYALELIEQLTGDIAQAQAIRKSRIQMLKCVALGCSESLQI